MLIKAGSQSLVITDMRNIADFRRYMSAERKNVIKPVKALWEKQKEVVNIGMADRMIQSNGVPPELLDSWRDMIIDFVEKDLAGEWIKGITAAGNVIARKVNKIQRKQYDFNTTMTSVKSWIDSEGGKLIVNLTAAQYASAHALIQNQITWGVTSPYLMAQRIKPLIGLTLKESLAVSRLMTAMIEEGVSASVMDLQVGKYAKFLHNNRAMRIARTEISNSYNFGQLDSVRQAREEGWLPGEPEKSWIAGGANPCEICEGNEADGPIPIDQQFSSGHDTPTAHPSCACSVGYSVRR